jgi:hypothetical protein
MFTKAKEIKFIFPQNSKELFEDILPKPAVKNIPNWFKNLKHTMYKKTIKGCMPFLDSLTAGYIISFPQDFTVTHNFINKIDGEEKPDSFFKFAHFQNMHDINDLGINLNHERMNVHPIYQVGEECPFTKKNKNLPFYKILLPFIVRTPPGYSCLFTRLLNNQDDRFEPISGIVDTDTYSGEVNIPIVFNGDKYPTLETTFKRGEPLVQIIPFKRDNWKSISIEENKNNLYNRAKMRLDITRQFFNNYKELFWNKKSWK